MKSVLYLYSVLIFSINSLFAKELNTNSDYHLEHYGIDRGLPQSSIKSMAMDGDGFLWLATEGGFVRFDGAHFYNFDKDRLATASHRILNIQRSLDSVHQFYGWTEDHEYIGVKNGKAYKYDYEKYLRSLIPITKNVYDCYVSPGIRRMFYKNFKSSHYIIPGSSPGSYYDLTDNDSIMVYKKGRKMGSFNRAGRNEWDYFRMDSQLVFVNSLGVLSLMNSEGDYENLKITGDILTHPLVRLEKEKITIYFNDIASQCFFYFKKNIYEVSIDNENNQLACQLVVSDFDCDENNIQSVYYDKINKRLFLGSSSDGLFVLTRKKFRTLTSKGGKNENVYYSQSNFFNNSVLTNKGVVLGLEMEAKSLLKKEDGLPWDSQTDLVTDLDGYMWVRRFNYLCRLSRDGTIVLNRWHAKDVLSRMYTADGRRIWMGDKVNELYYIDIDKRNLIKYSTKVKNAPSLTFIKAEGKKRLWLGSTEGLFFVNLVTKTIYKVKNFPATRIRSISVTRENEVWVTTYEQGFFLVQGDKITHFPLDQRRFMSGIHCMTEDKNGFFWLTTNMGLFQVARLELLRYAQDKRYKPYYLYYSKESGFLTNEFNGGCQPCAIRTGTNHLSLPSMKGLVWFRPEEIIRELPSGKIFIDEYRIGKKSFAVKSDTITLPMDARDVEIYVSNPFFGNRNNLEIEYSIKSDENDFAVSGKVDMTKNYPGINFSHLPGGKCKVFFRLANGTYNQPYTTREITLISPKHFYETILFRILMFLLIGCFILFSIWFRTRQIKRRNERLELTILQRTEELQNTLTVLRNSGEELEDRITQKSRIIASISHDINTPLQYHAVLVEYGRKLVKDKDLEQLGIVFDNLASSTTQITSFTSNLLDYIKVQNDNFRSYNELISLHFLVQTKLELFKPMAKIRHNRFENRIDPSTQIYSNPVLLGILIHNLIDNAHKFTYNGVVRILLNKENANTTMIVHNTQGGMSKETAEWLTSPFKEAPKLSATSKRGLGLIIVKEMSSVLNIKLKVEATETSTRISLTFQTNSSTANKT